MTEVTKIKITLAIVGVAIWGYGVRVEERRVQWAGIALIAISALLRFVERGSRRSPHA